MIVWFVNELYRVGMKAFFGIFFLITLSVMLIEGAEAAALSDFVSGLKSERTIVEKVHHQCVPSKCWCGRGGGRVCTRDCRRDRHCMWIPSRKTACNREWRCNVAPKTSKKDCKRCKDEAYKKYLTCSDGPRDNVKRRNCKARYANDVSRCKVLHCSRR